MGGIIVSASNLHGKHLPRLLARKLEKHDVPVLLTKLPWPRDELIIYTDGSYNRVEGWSPLANALPHFTYKGGTFLKGSNFILGSLTACPEKTRKRTHKMLEVDKGFYFDISEELDSLTHIPVNGVRFFSSSFPHMDVIYNLGNLSETLFTYDHPKLIETGEQMSEVTGYALVTIPLEEAIFASVGFIEYENKMVVDRRAKETKKVLEKLGYEVITTPFGLGKTNSRYGSLHCMTTEMPLELERIVVLHPDNAQDYSQRLALEHPLLFNLNGETVLTEEGPLRLKLRY